MLFVVRRGELTDRAWAQVEPLLPGGDGRGRRWRDHRQVINGILWRLRTGSPWRDVPERYGPWQTCYERYKRWDEDGTWASLLEHMQVKDDSRGTLDIETVSIDSSIARAHQHAAGARKKKGGPVRGRSDRMIIKAGRRFRRWAVPGVDSPPRCI